MNTMQQALSDALAADIAYVEKLKAGLTAKEFAELTAERMTSPLASRIGNQFQVLAVKTATGISDYQGVVLRDVTNDTIYFANRGTESATDIVVADVDLAVVSGVARFQVASMVNWWLDISRPAGSLIQQIQAVPQTPLSAATFTSAGSKVATGELAEVISRAASQGKLRVVGHSLGGHLTTVLTSLFADEVSHAATFNGAGLFSTTALANALANFVIGDPLQQIASLIGTSVVLPQEAKLDNFFAKNGMSLTTNALTFTQLGKRIGISNERSMNWAGDFPNHFLYKQTDALALFSAFEKLDPSLTLDRLNTLADASSAESGSSLERMLDALRLQGLSDQAVTGTPTIDIGGTTPERTEFHKNLNALLANETTFSRLAGKVAIESTESGIGAEKVRDSFGYLLALKNLSPFVIRALDDSAAGTLKLANTSLASEWERDQALSAAERTAGAASYSDAWIEDRSVLIKSLFAANKQDNASRAYVSGVVGQKYELRYFEGGEEKVFFADPTLGAFASQNLKEQLVTFADDSGRSLMGTDNSLGDHLFGGKGKDTLSGNAGDDYLEGNEGDDELWGGRGNDVLIGGTGADTYVVNAGDGEDVIVDFDGRGILKVRGRSLNSVGAVKVAEGVWRNANQNVSFILGTDGAGHSKLTVIDQSVADQPIKFSILNFANNTLGLELPGFDAGTVPPGAYTSRTILGDYQPADQDPTQSGVQVGYDDLGNVIVTSVREDYRSDVVFDSVGNDYIDVGAGNNVVNSLRGGSDKIFTWSGNDTIKDSGGGDDRIESGTGNDRIEAGSGMDTVVSGSGEDIVFGQEGDDLLYDNYFNNALESVGEAYIRGETEELPQGYGGRGDLVDGGAGNDQIFTTAYDDLVAGGDGNDVIVAGGGDDIVYGDVSVTNASSDWSVARNTIGTSDTPAFVVTLNSGTVSPITNSNNSAQNAGGSDAIFGGTGKDWIFAGGGNDFADGGKGDDVLFGEGGNDLLMGQDGDDQIFGDGSSVTIAAQGNDTIYGGNGKDTLIGGAGNDFIDGGNDENIIFGDAGGVLDQGQGNDYLVGGSGKDIIIGGGGNDSITGGDGGDASEGGAQQLEGDSALVEARFHGNDTITGGSGVDNIIGGGGSDTIFGGGGDDVILGDYFSGEAAFQGNDTIDGGAGDDRIDGNGGDDQISGGEGRDLLRGGAGNDNLAGGNDKDILFGGDGDDVLDGGLGDNNYLDGGKGRNTLVSRGENDAIVAKEGENIIRVGGAGTTAIDGNRTESGSNLVQMVTIAGRNQAQVGFATDKKSALVIQSQDGSKIVIDGALNHAFSNSYSFGETFDGADPEAITQQQLLDAVDGYTYRADDEAGASIAGSGGADNLTLGNLGGFIQAGRGDDIVNGGSGGDSLDGGFGADIMAGHEGDDEYSVDDAGDRVVEGFNEGIDTVYSTVDTTLSANVEHLVLDSVDDRIGTGNELDNSITGGEGHNVLYGLAGHDSLIGGSQNDVLEGGQGNDQLFGLDGNDTYVFGAEVGDDTLDDSIGDNILRFNEGIRLQDIHSRFVNANGDITINYATDASVTVVGSENGGFSQVKFADGTEMSRSAFLDSTLQNNLLVGTPGNDALVGANGTDLVFGSSGDDGLSGLGGNDTISGEGGNDILAGGDGNDVLNGGEGDDFIDGGAGNNIIESGAGNDVMVGGEGNDTYIAGNLGEIAFKRIVDSGGQNFLRFGDGVSIANITSTRGEGNDVFVNIDGTTNSILISDGLSGSISNFQFADGSSVGYSDFLSQTWAGGDLIGTSADDDLRGGTCNESLSGLEGDDRLSGGAGDDALSGGEGRDTLEGGEGNDLLSGDAEDDSLRGGGGNDELHGGDGRDQMDGGSGDDLLSGDEGVDTYLLNAGGGQDVIIGEAGANKILLGGSAGLTSVRARTEGADVLVWRPTTGDSMRLTGYRDGGQTWQIESADGHSITLEDLLVATATGNAGDGSTASKIATYRDIFAEKQLLSSSDGLSGMTLPEGSSAFSYTDRNGNRTDYQLGITRRNFNGDDAQIVADGAEEYSSVVTSQTSETRTTYTNSYETTTSTEPTVKLVPLDPSRFADSGIVGLSGTVSGGYLIVNGKPKVTTTTTVVKTPHVEVIDHVNRSVTNTVTIDSVLGGSSNNAVQTSGAGKLVDTGAGNDTVVDANSQSDPGHASHNDSNTDRYGDFLYGNAGDDILNGRDLRDELIGGAGSDTMDGGKGADTYRIFADEDGRDLVLDSGANPLRVSIHLNAVVDGEGLGLVWSQVLDIVGDLPRTEGALNAVVSLGLREDPYHPGTYVLDQPDFNSPDYYDQVQGLPSRIVSALAPFFPGLQDRFDQMVTEGQGQVQIDANGNIQAGFHIDTDFTSPAAEGLTGSDVEDVVSFEAGIDRNALVVNWTSVNNNGEDHTALEISWGGSGSVRVLAPQANDPSGLGVEKFQFADGTSMSMSEMLTLANWVPTVEVPLTDQSTAEGMDFEYVVPQGLFHDADAGQSLTVSATLSDGQELPSWLTFDAQTGKFSGVVPGNASGTLEVKVTATDPRGAKASDVFSIAIADVNRAPVIVSPIDGVEATQDQVLSFTVPDGTFADPDAGDVLTYAAKLANGDPLPDWLSFDADTRTFAGTPGSGDVRDLDVKVIATDTGGQSVSQSFSVAVANVNDAPVVMNPIAEQTASEDAAFHFTVPADAFRDADAGDSLAFTATLENGDDLPAWLTFDAETQTFSGTPAAGDIGALVVKLSVQDAAGLSTSQSFRLNVADVNHAPGTGDALPAQTASEDAAFSYTLPASAFADADTGDALALTAKLANGDALPSWLTFDAATQTFAGTPTNGDVGQLDLVITAADSAGLTASQTLHLNVANVNDAPEAIGVIVPPGATENAAYSFAIPSGSFADVDAGDSLRYTAKLANGDALPSWLSLTTGPDGALRLTGTPPKSSPNALDIVLTATDLAGASASSSFALAIAHAPQDPGVVLTGTRRSDTLTGGSGNDTLSGGGGNDTLNGTGGSDTLNGDAGADTLNGGDDGDLLFGNGGADTLNGDAGNDELHGGLGGDVLNGGTDNDLLFGDEGLDQLFGGSGNDYLNGGTGADALDGGEGNDVLEGAQGADVITDLQGNNLLSGNQGSDQLTGGNGNNVFIGGLTNDSIVSGSGNDLFAFNALDGDDHIRLGGGEDTLSLGGGIRYEDLSLLKQGNNLRLNLGNGDTITFDDWYTSPANQSLVNLQVIADSLGDYNASGTNVLKDNRVESFDFQALVGKFEEARAANPRLNRWSMMNSMLGAHLGGSDVAAMGGDLAYQYGHAGSLANVSVDAAQAMLASAQLNIDPQALQSVAALQTGGQRLM